MGNYRLAIYTGREYDADNATEIEYSTGKTSVSTPTAEGYNYVFISTPTALGKPIFRNSMNIDISNQADYVGKDEKEGYEPNSIWRWGMFGTGHSTQILIDLNDFYETNDSIKILQGESYKEWIESGYYIENLISKGGCDSIVRTHLTVCPDTDIDITAAGDTLTGSADYQSYQWYNMEGKIEGATFNEFVIEKSGTYYLEVKDENGCSFRSNEFSMIKTGIGNMQTVEYRFKVIPNPNSGQFRLRFDNAEPGDYEISIFNELGQIAVNKTVSITSERFEEDMNVQSMPKGNYIIHVKNSSVIESQKLIIK